MSESLVQRFIDGLHRLEETKDPESLVALYARESETSNVVADRIFAGPDGARDFWTRYRGAFGEAHSSFRNEIVAGGRAALEWTTEGTDPQGEPFRYDGVSILEMAGEGEAEAITRFRAFFDSVHLGRQVGDKGRVAAVTITSAGEG